ncbi:MAG: acyltransferase family protein [Propioniciclava sp.]|uniref:acyltransferase family protein n=1 Tax=Propioniciclava sp. TaxID=2038686 RepID=UPI0039E45EA9
MVNSRRPGYRAELNGLRAVAIGMVVVYHVYFGRVSGGVDVFLLISSFLMTTSFADRLERGRPLRVGGYWVKAFKRLLPPAVITILGTLVLMYLFFPAFRWREILTQALATVFYAENWHLAASAVDYYAGNKAEASPLQHFWSLSVQGQVFLLWPLLFLLAGRLVRRGGWRVRRALTLVFGTVFAASLAWSVWSTANLQAFAYFDTFARLWEFALGSLLAVHLPRIEARFVFGPLRAPGRYAGVRAVLGWVGMIALLSCGFLIEVERSFPGWIALWPLGAACLIIAAGRTGKRWGVDHWLSSPILDRLGDMSYALYLVHWPILVTLLVIQDRPVAGPLEGVVILALSLRLAWVLTKNVDAPIRRAAAFAPKAARGLVVIGACLLLVVLPVFGAQASLDARAAAIIAGAAENNPGAAVLLNPELRPVDPDAEPLPLVTELEDDWTPADRPCTGRFVPADRGLAEACEQSAEGEPGKLLVVVGNSRMQQLAAAVRPLAEQRGYTLVTLLKGGCPLGFEGVPEFCRDWNRAVVDYVRQVRPRALISTTTFIPKSGPEAVLGGVSDMVGQLTAEGIDVIGLRDQPRFASSPVACLLDRGESACAVPAAKIFDPKQPNNALVKSATGRGAFRAVDLTPWICPEGQCVPLIGNVFVYLDPNHLTATYARTLAPILDEELRAAGWRW